MGCSISKHRDQCPHCRSFYNPVKRSHSMQVYRVLAPPPSSLKLDHSHENGDHCDYVGAVMDSENRREEFAVGVNEAKIWSSLIEGKIPKTATKTVSSLIEECPPIKTPLETPPGEPETIDALDLMKGLEDNTPLTSQNHFSFDLSSQKNPPFHQTLISKSGEEDEEKERKKEEESHVVVVYFTTLRGIRKTYENCCDVRSILKNLGFRLDERDVSMHAPFKQELMGLLRDGAWDSSLPQIFFSDKHIGGAEEIRRLHEEGRLEKALEGCRRVNRGDGACEICGDARFVPCSTCYGSCKVYYEDECGEKEEELGFRRCLDCNENGLRRCPACCVL